MHGKRDDQMQPRAGVVVWACDLSLCAVESVFQS